MTERLTATETDVKDRRFVWSLAIAAALLAILPAVFAFFTTPAGSTYAGYQYNTDDHMVYAAWMRQAMDGRFFFDNRFTIDSQPGLTVHLYFFLLGLLAKKTGIVLATTLARVGFSVLFVFLAHRLIRRLEWEAGVSKLALALTVVGGGLGFLVWHNFGQEIVKPSPLSGIMMGRLPTDVWQPEAFVFPSMLTNSLFMVSLCLILLALEAFLAVRESPKAIITGALAMGVLMNVHSYDVLLIGLVLVAFVASAVVLKQMTDGWLGRAVLISCGCLPAAVWFVHVLRNDPVFQSRAATETFAPNFRQVAFGYALLMVLAFYGAIRRASDGNDRKRRLAGIGLAITLFVVLFVLAANHTGGYFLAATGFAVAFVVAVASVALASDPNPTWNLLFSWAVVGTVAIYFPGTFSAKAGDGP